MKNDNRDQWLEGTPETGDVYDFGYPQDENAAQLQTQARQARKRNKSGGLAKLLVLLMIVTAAILIVDNTVLRLETVYVIGNEEKTPQQLVTASGLVRGRNMLSIEEADVAKAIAQDHTLVFEGMQKEYPGTIYLYIRERHPAAVMQWLGMLYILDDEGIVLSEENSTLLPQGMPMVTGMMASGVQVGQQMNPRVNGQMEAYCAIVKELDLQMYKGQVTEINLSDPQNIYIVTSEGVTVRLGDGNYMQAKIGSVRTCMAYQRQLGKMGGILDVTTPEEPKYMPEG